MIKVMAAIFRARVRPAIGSKPVSTLQDRHRTHAATLRVGKAQKRLHCRPLATMVERRGFEAFKGVGRRLDRNDTQQQ